MKHLLQRLIRRTGYDLRRIDPDRDISLFVPMLLVCLGITTVLDVGANAGQYGRRLRQGGYRGEIISFEPSPKAFGVLQQVCARDGNWTAHQLALGETSASAELKVMAESVFSSLLPPSSYGAERFSESITQVDSVPVQVERLDAILDSIVPAGPVFLKMVTQGYNQRVLAGASGCLDRIAGLQTAVAALPLYDGAPTYHEALSEVEELGFALAGVFNMHRDHAMRLGEFDCVMVRDIHS